jgi:hypothetical protein
MIKNPIHLVKSLKGSAISILFALAIVKQNCGAEWLSRVTGYSMHPILEGLKLLEEYDLVIKIDRYHWGLSASAHRLPIMIDNSALPLIGENSMDGTGNYCKSDGAAASNATIVGKRQIGRGEVEENKLTRDNRESIEILHKGGVGEPTASRLAKLDWMTPEYVKAHLAKGKTDGVGLALVIHRMRSHDQEPESGINWDRRSYIEGPYKDWIEH